MPSRSLAISSLLLLGAALHGCDERREPEPAAPVDHGTAPDPARDPLGARLHAAVASRAGRMEEVGTLTRGTMAQGGSAEQGILLYGGYCYTIFVEAAEAGDLRVRLVDTNGDPLQIDRDRGASASLGVAEPLCPDRPGEYRLEISSPRGGAYAMRAFRAQAL
jgi:hypothetical protein